MPFGAPASGPQVPVEVSLHLNHSTYTALVDMRDFSGPKTASEGAVPAPKPLTQGKKPGLALLCLQHLVVSLADVLSVTVGLWSPSVWGGGTSSIYQEVRGICFALTAN